MNANSISASLRDYFELPACTDEVADRAYRNFVSHGVGTDLEFSQVLEASAWMQFFGGEGMTPQFVRG